jgi:alpha-L-fucosidase 2
MLLQSGSDAVHILPALPDVWPTGSVHGLRAKGGFEIVDLQWKDSKIIKLTIKSTLGGNLRLRVPNVLIADRPLELAAGKNSNPFYFMEETPSPVIAKEVTVGTPDFPTTLLYDIPTEAGKQYTFVSQ